MAKLTSEDVLPLVLTGLIACALPPVGAIMAYSYRQRGEGLHSTIYLGASIVGVLLFLTCEFWLVTG